ncbi:unnamed protein product [Calicophoron daubneyi]|uniref:Transmembrane protein 168 n=1 Tax=Calicophoron daubneyi TaxID=300641 RepID=A0AAV2T7C6_CALDB
MPISSFSYPNLISGLLLSGPTINVVLLIQRRVLPTNVEHILLAVILSLSLLFAVLYYFRVPHSFKLVAHFLLGYSFGFLLLANTYNKTIKHPLLTALSSILLVLSLVICYAFEAFRLSRTNFIMDTVVRTDLALWAGFTFVCIAHRDFWFILTYNLILLTFLFALRQISALCLVAFLLDFLISVLYILPRSSTPQSFAESIRRIFLEPAEQTLGVYYITVCIPVLITYSLYFVRPQIYRNYFFSQDLAARWRTLIQAPLAFRLVFSLLVISVQLWLIASSSAAVLTGPKLYIMIPFFISLIIVWLPWHLIAWISIFKFNLKISRCNKIYRSMTGENQELTRIWVSNGLRHFAFITKWAHLSCVFTTLPVLFSWMYAQDAFTVVQFWEICIPIEVCFFEFFRELSRCGNGSCVGYALVMQASPISKRSLYDSKHPLESWQNKTVSTVHRMTLIQTMERFFNEFLIHNHGCVFSSSFGPEKAAEIGARILSNTRTCRSRMLLNIENFFAKRMPNEGLWYDSYLLYYSGPTTADGDWLLEDGDAISLESILELWTNIGRENDKHLRDCRLILVLDCLNTVSWYEKLIAYPAPISAAVQTVIINAVPSHERGLISRLGSWFFSEPESYEDAALRVGEFTYRWVDWNIQRRRMRSSASVSADCVSSGSSGSEPKLSSVYSTTARWRSHSARVLSNNEMEKFCKANFPSIVWKALRPLNLRRFRPKFTLPTFFRSVFRLRPIRYALAAISHVTSELWATYRHIRAAYLVPYELDIALDFRLVRKHF